MTERILIVHNAYQHRGGEDSVVEAGIALLRSHGNVVKTYFRNNNDVAGMPPLALARQTLWSTRTARDLAELIGSFHVISIRSRHRSDLSFCNRAHASADERGMES